MQTVLTDLITSLIALILGLYVFSRNPQSKINFSFLLFSIAQFVLNFSSYNFHVAPTYEVAYIWSLGYMSYHWGLWGIGVFIYAITEKWKVLFDRMHLLLFHLPAILFTISYALSFAFFPNISVENGFWSLSINYDAPSALFLDISVSLWGIGIYFSVVKMALDFAKRTFDPLKKAQMRYILFGVLASVLVELVGMGEWFGFPAFTLPFLTSSMIFAVFVTIAITRFDFFAVTASAAADSIVSTMSDAIILLSPDGKVMFVNTSTKRLLGLSEEQITGKKIDTFIRVTDHRSAYSHINSRLCKLDSVQDVEGEMLSAGKKIAISLSAAYITNSRKDITRGIVCIIRDITDRKLQENRLRSSYESIRMADQQIKLEITKLQGTFEALPQGLILLSEQGHIVMMNTATRALLGWKEEQVVGALLSDVFVITTNKGEREDIQKRLSSAISRGRKLRFTLSDAIYVVANRRRIPISLTSAPITLDGVLVGSVIAFENITREMEIDKAKSEFVSLAAHQLKTPLSGIKWNLELQNENLPDMKEVDDNDPISVSYSLAASMTRLVDQFLNVSRLELGKLTVEPEPTNLINVCREVVTEQQQTATHKKQHFKVEYPKKIQDINLDKVLIRIVVQNLLSNAIKYTPEKGNVLLKLTTHRGYAKLIVKDTGIGIPEADQKNLFVKLFRANNALKSGLEGNGLGLYIVRSIVKLMKGDISFESKEGKGTVFTVVIPYKGMEKHEGTRSLIEVNT